jgi:nucleobase:cation symporter-1, NCS1 family
MDSMHFTPPVRRSLSDAQLSEVLNQPHADEASLLSAMQLLESQSVLRTEELKLEQAWVQEMLKINTPESLAALAAFRDGSDSDLQAAEPADEVAVQSHAEPRESAQPQAAVSLFDQIAAQQKQSPSVAPQEHTSEIVDSASGPTDAMAPSTQLTDSDLDSSTPADELSTKPDAQDVAETYPVAELDVVDEPSNTFYPLIQVAPEPDISVSPQATQRQVAANSVEQQITEIEENRSSVDIRPSEIDAVSTIEILDSEEVTFENLVGIAPVASNEYLDEARSAVSTGHRPSSNEGAIALFFNWLPIGGSVLPVALAVYVHSLGLPLTDAVVALLMAIFAAFATTTSGAIAGKRAGLPTFVVSRATFGVFGARIPSGFFAVIKLISASVMVLLLVVASQGALAGWSVEGPTATRWMLGSISVALWQVIIGAAVFLVATTSFIKLRYIKFLNLLVGIIATIGVMGSLAFRLLRSGSFGTFSSVQSWPLTVGAATLVFAALGSVWSSSGADFASILKKDTKGSHVIGWSALSLFVVPSSIAVATLVLLDTQEAKTTLLGVASIVPDIAQPYAYGVFVAVVLLLAALELRSTRLAVRGLYSRFSGPILQTILALAFVGLSLAGWHFYSTQGLLFNLRDYALVLSVPVAAWLGIFASDSLMRRIAYHDISLTRSYGFYGNFNLINLFGWVLASALGLGMLSSTLREFEWVGFLARYSVNPSFWSESNLGVAAAFAIGVLFPLCFGVPRIRRQEAEVLSIESRRYELRDVLSSPEGDRFEPTFDALDSAI